MVRGWQKQKFLSMVQFHHIFNTLFIINTTLAQLGERQTEDLEVTSSILVCGTKNLFNQEFLSSTELIFLNGTKKDGPALPQSIFGHCLVKYKHNIFMTGGNGQRRSIVIFNEDFEKIGIGPDMTNDREGHSCGIFYSSQHGGRPILVIAGGSQSATTSEHWDFTVPDSKWQKSSKSYVVQFSLLLELVRSLLCQLVLY